jgi:hypothetical protein
MAEDARVGTVVAGFLPVTPIAHSTGRSVPPVNRLLLSGNIELVAAQNWSGDRSGR